MKTLQGLRYFIFLVTWSELVSEINPILSTVEVRDAPVDCISVHVAIVSFDYNHHFLHLCY